jgi:DeoR/GlpR family transcriptional regulator of sugar metabolism
MASTRAQLVAAPGGEVLSGRPRLDRVREYVLANLSVSPAELARRFGVSLMTVHRDLAELERQGVVHRFRGGVTAQPSGVFESNIEYRLNAMQAEKAAIASHARSFIEPGMAILLDDSTTCLALARHLDGLAPLTVVTNQLGILDILSRIQGIHLIGLGGDYDPRYNSFTGMTCVATVESLRVDIAFVSAYGVSGAYAYHQEQQIVAGKRAMLASAERKVLLVDHSKLGRRALHQVCELSVFDLVVVDDGATAEALAKLEEAKVGYVLAATAVAGSPKTYKAMAARRGLEVDR